jgi:hypothetical protein
VGSRSHHTLPDQILDYIDRLKLGRRKDEPPPVTDGRRKEQLAKVRTETDKVRTVSIG